MKRTRSLFDPKDADNRPGPATFAIGTRAEASALFATRLNLLMGIAAILMAVDMLFAGLHIGARERDHGENGGSQGRLGYRHH